MKETILRARGIIGSLKILAIVGLFFSALLLIGGIRQSILALKNPTGPRTVTIGQIVAGEVGEDQYVSVSGYALYEEAYSMEVNGKKVATYHYLFDDTSGHAVVIGVNAPSLHDRTSKRVTLTGMTGETESDLKKLIERDAATLREEGFTTNADVYISEGATPPDMLGALTLTFVAGILVLLCLTLLLFPTAVFAPQPMATVTGPVQGDEGVKATGRFLRLKQVQPTIEMGRGSRKFNKAVANVINQGNKRLMIYIHHVVRTSVYGVPVGQRETDWGIFLDHGNVHAIEPGILYGWKNRSAVRIQYVQNNQPQTLILSFDQPWGQNLLVRRLRLLGFPVTQPGSPADEVE